MEPRGEGVGDLKIVLLGKREVRVALDADVGEFNDLDVASVAVDDIGPKVRHFNGRTPVVRMRIVAFRFRNEVTVVDDDREAGEFLKL